MRAVSCRTSLDSICRWGKKGLDTGEDVLKLVANLVDRTWHQRHAAALHLLHLLKFSGFPLSSDSFKPTASHSGAKGANSSSAMVVYLKLEGERDGGAEREPAASRWRLTTKNRRHRGGSRLIRYCFELGHCDRLHDKFL